jgi:hypothetical protein
VGDAEAFAGEQELQGFLSLLMHHWPWFEMALRQSQPGSTNRAMRGYSPKELS